MADSTNEDEIEKLSQEEVDKCLAVLQKLVSDTNQIFDIPEDKRLALIMAAGEFSRPSKQEFTRRKRAAKKAAKKKSRFRDKQSRNTTGIRSARDAHIFVAPKMLDVSEKDRKKEVVLESPRNCYVCKEVFHTLHHFYDTMCKECGDFNYAKRFQTADIAGQTALVTGSRLKIGYHITLLMLRAGATVIATTRFPVDSAIRFAKEPDFKEWGHRLKIHGLDLRHIPSVEIFCNFIEQQYDKLDILINNAAQTVRRPAGFYEHLMENEEKPLNELPQFAQELLADHTAC